MTQTHIKHHSRWPVPKSSALSEMDWITIWVSGMGCVFALVSTLFMNFPAAACVIISAGLWLVFAVLWPIRVALNYWRRVHVGMRLAWVPFGYATVFALVLNLVFITDGQDLLLGEWMIFWGLPCIAFVLAMLLGRKRGDRLLLLQLIPQGLVVLASTGSLIYFQKNPAKDGFGLGTAFSLIMLVGGTLQLLPVAICLAVLKYKGLYGTSPGWTEFCAACEYDLTGTVAGDGTQCPECGKAIANEQVALVRKRIAGNPATAGANDPEGAR
jgi:hypothetical protein